MDKFRRPYLVPNGTKTIGRGSIPVPPINHGDSTVLTLTYRNSPENAPWTEVGVKFVNWAEIVSVRFNRRFELRTEQVFFDIGAAACQAG